MQQIQTRAKKLYARGLRRHQTAGEQALWILRLVSYSPQQVTFGYIPDFYSRLFKVAIEVDGSIHQSRDVKKRDKQKRRNLRGHKVYTMRVGNWYALHLPGLVMIEALLTGIIWRLWSMITI